jgi:hypothetical protein
MDSMTTRDRGHVVALRYLTTDGRIEMCWPCRVVEDNEQLLALFIAAGSRYKAGPKRTAAEKLSMARIALPPDEYVWRKDTLRLMFPGRQHSVWLSWMNTGSSRRFSGYFVNMEEPFRRTRVGFDTQDHTLDIEVAPDQSWKWRDTEELNEHVKHRFTLRVLRARCGTRAGGRSVKYYAAVIRVSQAGAVGNPILFGRLRTSR